MQIARVIGTVVSTIKNKSLEGRKILIVQNLINQSVLNIDSTGIETVEVADQFFVSRHCCERVFGQ